MEYVCSIHVRQDVHDKVALQQNTESHWSVPLSSALVILLLLKSTYLEYFLCRI